MYKNLEYISTKGMSREDWLFERKGGIGGSDAGAIIGVNPYRSPYSVWADKLGKLPDIPDNEAMRQGRDLEEYVAQRFTEETGKKVKRRNAIIHNPKIPYALANVDRLVVGEDAILECKTSSELRLKKYKAGEYPDTYYTQCMHYMLVTGAKKVYLAVLVFSRGFYIFEIERDEEEIQALAEAEAYFWNNYVIGDDVPPIDGSESTGEAIASIYDNPNGGELQATSTINRALTELEYYKAQKKDVEREIKERENIIKEYLGDNELVNGDNYSASWKYQERSTFDYKRYIADNPDVDFSSYYKTSSSRVFRTKKVKKEEMVNG